MTTKKKGAKPHVRPKAKPSAAAKKPLRKKRPQRAVAFDVSCPSCGAPPGRACVALTSTIDGANARTVLLRGGFIPDSLQAPAPHEARTLLAARRTAKPGNQA